jgi:hypothetical protein
MVAGKWSGERVSKAAGGRCEIPTIKSRGKTHDFFQMKKTKKRLL